MDWQPVATLIAAIAAVLAAGISAFTLWKLQDKKRNDDIDVKAFDHSLSKSFKEFEQMFLADNSYLAEKGKNTATKEDIEEVTRKIESIKNEFATPVEVLKWQLSKRANLHRLQAEKEFEVFSKMWDQAISLKFAVEQLRPRVDIFDGNEPANERWSRRYSTFIESGKALWHEIEKQRPFYPNSLYLKFSKILQTANEEIVDFEFSLDDNKEKMSYEGYNRGYENAEKIISDLNELCDLMRKRISESE